ncbi:MAG: tyrosine-type recombinase/integrase [Solirubrobacteraceae bacterium]
MAFPRVYVDEVSEAVVDAYCRYELIERRLAVLTVTNAAYGVRQFLAWRAATGRPPIEHLEPVELEDFVLHEARRLKRSSLRSRIAYLRTFVRFLFATGVTARDLSSSVPQVASARFDGLPRALDPSTVSALLGSCDRARPAGRRDYAIFVLMVRLGLRAVEVARMQQEDIDWRAGEILVRGKGGRQDRLPLPGDVGEALVDYLRFGRPVSASRAVFLACRGEPVGVSRHAVVLISQTACQRLGVPTVGGHALRHTAATNLLQGGASLREVGDVLRQSDAGTTGMYAKVDRNALTLAVRSWPTDEARS